MQKKIIIIAFLVAFAVPYGAKLLARKDKVRQLKSQLEKVNAQIKQLEQNIETTENQCEEAQTEAICAWANQDISVKGIELERLKRQRKDLKEKIASHKKALHNDREKSAAKKRTKRRR